MWHEFCIFIEKKDIIMDFKTFWHTQTAFILKNILAAMIVALLILVFVVMRLRRYTEHGIEVTVPDLVGLYVTEAEPMVSAEGLRLVIVDSTYSRKVPLGTIVEQNPPANSHAKHDRAVYVTVNASSVRQIPMPDLHDISYRQAEATLRSLGFQIKEVQYEPSEFKDLVLDIRQNGRSLEVGDRVPENSQLTLVVGRGRGTEMVSTPNLQGRSLTEARSLLLANYLTLGVTEYDVPPTEEDKEGYFVYSQTPAAGTMIQEGSHVDIYLSTNIEKAITNDNTGDEEDFF